ncbi:hypothetical protein [Streptomyces sp. NPDC023838]|uniref:hypothetical protein n=1 Tax=Streptomyces sp. NPDC023838 TaxID=3154325 RepID=UPI0033F98509
MDDTAHSHPKILRAGNAAVGLWMRCGAYSAMHLTDGVIPGPIASMYGTAPQVKKLVQVGLWHAAGHGCARCPQPGGDDFVMHDFAIYQPSRDEVSEGREKAAAKKRRQREEAANRSRIGADSDSNRSRIDDESSSIHRPVSDELPGHSDVSRGDSPGTRARASRPDPTRPYKGGDRREQSAGSGTRAQTPLSQIPPGWKPNPADHTAAAADLTRLGAAAAATATAKFVRHHQAKGTTAADFGPLWVSWLARERPATQGAFLVGLPGGATPTPPSFRQRMAELDAAAEADRARDRQEGTAG